MSSQRIYIQGGLDMDDLVGEMIRLEQDSGAWEDNVVVYKQDLGMFKYEFLTRINAESILSRPLVEGQSLEHIAGNKYVLHTPRGGGGAIYYKYFSVIPQTKKKVYPPYHKRDIFLKKAARKSKSVVNYL